MPAENMITMTGWIVGDVKVSDSNRPSSFRLKTYCAGSKAKDNVKVAFLSVKTFDHDAVRKLDSEERVRVTGRFDPWSPPDDPKRQILDVMVDTQYENTHQIVQVDRDGNVLGSKVAQGPGPDYDEEPF